MPRSLRPTTTVSAPPPISPTDFTGTPLPRTMMGVSPMAPPIGALPTPICLATSTPPRATTNSTS